MPDSDEERDPGEAVQGVEEDDEAPEPEADLQQEDVLGALSCAPAAIQLPIENFPQAEENLTEHAGTRLV